MAPIMNLAGQSYALEFQWRRLLLKFLYGIRPLFSLPGAIFRARPRRLIITATRLDLRGIAKHPGLSALAQAEQRQVQRPASRDVRIEQGEVTQQAAGFEIEAARVDAAQRHAVGEIGRASCRERV